jgi:hypothetical protein
MIIEDCWRIKLFNQAGIVLHILETTTLHQGLDMIRHITTINGDVHSIKMEWKESK